MELLDVVDEFGNKTGQVLEREKVHDLNLLHFEIAVFVINNKKEILLQKRDSSKRFDPDKWGLCAGHVESGEDIDEAAIREIEEEIGIKVSLKDLHILEKMEVKKREKYSHITRYYYIICNKNEFNIQKEELSMVKWFNIDKIIDMINNEDETLALKKDKIHLLLELKKFEV